MCALRTYTWCKIVVVVIVLVQVLGHSEVTALADYQVRLAYSVTSIESD